MSHVLSLIAAEAKALSPGVLDGARNALAAAGADDAAPAWLSPDEACDVPFTGDAAAVRDAVRDALAHDPIDVNVVPAASRRKKLLIADMDSTLIEQECVNELAAEIGMREQVAAITERAMRGEVAFEPALRERVALFKGLPFTTVTRVLETRITLSPGGGVLIATMRAAGAHTAIVSGGFTSFTGVVAARLGVHEHFANTLLEEDGALTGHVAEPVLGSTAKEETLARLVEKLGLKVEDALALGDGANDIGMIRRAGLGVAYRAKPALKAAADATLDHADLTGVLFLQGYRRDQFAAAPDRG